MHKNKAIQILKSLSPEEFKRFRKFVESPYFNSSKNIIKLYNILKKYYPEFENKALEIKNVYKKLYPSQKYNEGTIRNAISEFSTLAESFLSIEHCRADEFKMEEAKIHEFFERKLNTLFEKAVDKALSENKEINSMYNENYFPLIGLLELKIKDANNKMKLNKSAENISRQSEYISSYFLYKAFIAVQTTKINRHNYNAEYPDFSAAILDSINFEKVLGYAKKNSKKIYPILSLTYYAHKIFMNENLDENLINFDKIYQKVKSTLDKRFHYNMLSTVNGAFLFKLNNLTTREERKFCLDKLFSTYKFIDDEDLFPKKENFNTNIFKIITNVGVHSGNHEWTLMFMEKYKHLLRDDIRDDIVNYSSAVLYADLRIHEKALYYYNQIKKPDYMTLWMTKKGLAICHYELQNFETVLSLCDSTELELKRKYKNYSGHNTQLGFFVNLRKLTKLRLNYSNKNLEDFEVFLKASRKKYGVDTFFFEYQLSVLKKLIENVK